MRTRLVLKAALLVAISASAAAQHADQGVQGYLKERATAFVLDGLRVVDGTGARARENVSIVIQSGRIISVGSRPKSVPHGAKRIDLSGRTALPGLVMMHEHLTYFSGAYVWDAQPGSIPKLLLAAGVTTARTAGAESPQVDINLKRRIDGGHAAGPRLFITGPYLNGPEGGFLGDNVVNNAAEARAVTAYWGSRGATSVKVYSAISPDALRGAVEEANKRGMHVAGHLGEISCREAAGAGIHTIEHGLSSCVKDLGISPDAVGALRYAALKPAADRLIRLLVQRSVVVVATPPATEPFVPTEDELAMLSSDQLNRYRELVRNRPPWLPPLSAMPAWNAAHRAFERDFVAAGGRLLIGADAADFGLVPGYADHNAMVALANAGFGPLQVIRFATLDAATFLGIANRIGTIAPGMTADLLIVKGAPDRRMEDIRNVDYVFKDGLAYDPAKLRAAAKGQLGLH